MSQKFKEMKCKRK